MLSNLCFQKSNITGKWNFQNLKLGLEVFLNFFPCVYISNQGNVKKFTVIRIEIIPLRSIANAQNVLSFVISYHSTD